MHLSLSLNVVREKLISCFERDEDYVTLVVSRGTYRKTALYKHIGIISTFVLILDKGTNYHEAYQPMSNFSEQIRKALVEYVEEIATATLNEMRAKMMELFSLPTLTSLHHHRFS